MSEPQSPITGFLKKFWSDKETGSIKGLAAYLEQFPGDTEGIAKEYLSLTRGQEQLQGGSTAGPYKILRELGRGGQAVVYLAQDTRLKREVALKVIPRLGYGSEEAIARFKREGEIAAKLDHPAICAVHEFGTHGGISYIAMPYVKGHTLAQCIDSERPFSQLSETKKGEDTTEDLSIRGLSSVPEETRSRTVGHRVTILQIVNLIEKAARALQVAHDAGIIHRDIKPANIMVTPDYEPVLMDFGLAWIDDVQAYTLTRTGQFFGTPAYMSPEQLLAGRVQLDCRSDVFSLGVTLFECLTLQRPFQASTIQGLHLAIQSRPPIEARSLNPAISRDLEAVTLRALEKDRELRYATALEFADDLRCIREGLPVSAHKASQWQRAKSWIRRNRAVVLWLASVITILAVCLVVVITLLFEKTAAVHEAEDSRKRAAESLTKAEMRGDQLQLPSLFTWEAQLWPAAPRMIGGGRGFDSWIGAAERIIERSDRLADHLRNDAALPESIKADLLMKLNELPALLINVKERRTTAQTLPQRTVGDFESDWSAVSAQLSQGHPHYKIGALAPQEGLVPLGPDQSSGLFEFAVFASGDIPVRDSSGDLKLSDTSAIVLVLIPGGQTTFGSPDDEPGRNHRCEAQWKLNLAPYFLGKHEVTQGQFAMMMNHNPSIKSKLAKITDRHPVDNLRWAEANAFCERLDLVLPTEAQWERAARAGRPHAYGPWGTDAAQLNTAENIADQSLLVDYPEIISRRPAQYNDGQPFPVAVDALRPNAWGLFHMLGNLSEYCRDTYSESRSSRLAGPDGIAPHVDGAGHACRGGSWAFGPSAARCASRIRIPNETVMPSIGFRVARLLRTN